MLTVGYPSRRSAIARVGRWRAILLRSMARGYLKRNLGTTRYFRNLEQSEMAAMSFLLAQAFTYWFAQTHMGLAYVVHVRGAKQRFALASSMTTLKGGTFKPRSRPDFVGRSPGSYHIFESKGRSGTITTALMETALAQASMITRINGRIPTSRVAACFSFQANGVSAKIQDPDSIRGQNLVFDDVLAAEKVYSFFLDPEIRESSRPLIDGFQCVELGDGLIYGVDKKVITQLDILRPLQGDNRVAEPLLTFLHGRQDFYEQIRDINTSVGAEGIILRSNMMNKVTRPKIRLRRSKS